MDTILMFIMALNITIVVLGIVGNSLVITVVRKTRSMRTTTNFLLVNLAIADIITYLFNPFLHDIMWPTSLNSTSLCKFFTGNGFIGLPVSVSVLTLVAVAVERYHALVKPMVTRLRLTKENFHYAIIATWCVAIAMNIPIIIDYRADAERCKGVWDLDFSNWTARYMVLYATIAFVSAFVIGYCYIQIFRGLYITNTICPENRSNEQDRESKRKLAKLLMLITVIFYISVLPFNIFILYMAFKRRREYSDSILLEILGFLIMANSCANPVIYAFQSENYKSGFKRIFRCRSVDDQRQHNSHKRELAIKK